MGNKKPVLTRRDFIRGTIGVTLGASILGFKWPMEEARAAGSGLVTIVRDKSALDSSRNVDRTILEKMLEQTLIKVTGQQNPKDAFRISWARSGFIGNNNCFGREIKVENIFMTDVINRI